MQLGPTEQAADQSPDRQLTGDLLDLPIAHGIFDGSQCHVGPPRSRGSGGPCWSVRGRALGKKIQPLVEPGTTFDGHFLVEALIGVGGYAQVYRALRLDNRQPVAIKVLDVSKDPHRGRELERRFRREGRLAAQLSHRAIVAIYDIGVSPQGLPYMVLELLDGRTLTDTLRKLGPLTIGRASRLMGECLDALDMAHRQGVIHRDLKPDNLFVRAPISNPEHLCILDFGMAFLQGTDSPRSGAHQGVIYGTPMYMAPEYLEAGLVSPALDIYQMGLILAEMVSGRRAVDTADPRECFRRHRSGDLDIPPEVWSSAIGSVLKKALRSNHTRRFGSAAAFRDALVATLDTASEPRLRALPEVNRLRTVPSAGGLPATGDHQAVRLHPIAEIRRLATPRTKDEPDE